MELDPQLQDFLKRYSDSPMQEFIDMMNYNFEKAGYGVRAIEVDLIEDLEDSESVTSADKIIHTPTDFPYLESYKGLVLTEEVRRSIISDVGLKEKREPKDIHALFVDSEGYLTLHIKSDEFTASVHK